MNTPFYIPWADIRPGDQAQLAVVMDEEKVNAFSGVIGDTDSFHVSDEAAAATVFQRRICHGVHLLAYVSVAIGQNLPGFGTIYCSHQFLCHAPVYVGDTVSRDIIGPKQVGFAKAVQIRSFLSDQKDEHVALDAESPDCVIGKLQDLVTWLDQINPAKAPKA